MEDLKMDEKDYRKTLIYLKPTFPCAPICKRNRNYWKGQEMDIYGKVQALRKGRLNMFLYGPPYARVIFTWAAMNKDSKILLNTEVCFRCPYVPGWDTRFAHWTEV